MSDRECHLLDLRLKELGNRTQPFGGFSIYFSGDFCQIEPVRSRQIDLLFSTSSRRHWESGINTATSLDDEHRLMEDADYGNMLMHFWIHGLRMKDKKMINKSVFGKNAV